MIILMFHIKKAVRRGVHNIQLRSKVPLHWWNNKNWGDALNPVIAEFLSGRGVKYTKIKYCDGFLAIGSVLSSANSGTTVWGSGFMSRDQTCKEKPRKVCAVRGPLTRNMLLEQDIDCPEVYGDPALLLPIFYNKHVQKEFRLGVIPHYVDAEHPWVKTVEAQNDVRVIDVENGTFDFVDAVQSCEFIVSSSLHGLICADSYGIPNTHIELSKNVTGDNFKFRDYAASIGKTDYQPLQANIDPKVSSVVQEISNMSIDCDLKSLMLSCPFISDSLRRKVESLTSEKLKLSAVSKMANSTSIFLDPNQNDNALI